MSLGGLGHFPNHGLRQSPSPVHPSPSVRTSSHVPSLPSQQAVADVPSSAAAHWQVISCGQWVPPRLPVQWPHRPRQLEIPASLGPSGSLLRRSDSWSGRRSRRSQASTPGGRCTSRSLGGQGDCDSGSVGPRPGSESRAWHGQEAEDCPDSEATVGGRLARRHHDAPPHILFCIVYSSSATNLPYMRKRPRYVCILHIASLSAIFPYWHIGICSSI